MLQHLKTQDITFITSTPYMDEAEQCDRVALIDEGRILKIDNPEQIVASFRKPLFAVKAGNRYQLLKILRSYEYVHSVQPFGEFIHYTDRREHPDPGGLERYLAEAGLTNLTIKSIQPDIEDTFMALMQEEC